MCSTRNGSGLLAVQASVDGEHWQEGEAHISFRVLRPWYLQGWFLILVTAAVTSLAYGWHRMRVASMIRLEQQRARIAMDLHDEIGAGLGGIGLMAGLAARAETAPERRTELAGRVAAISSGLASSLQDIVWSLRPGATRLESLAAHIVDRGQALFADGAPEFISEIPERLPDVMLSLPVRRDVLLIAQEAMHNARRHSGARRVSVRLEPDGRRWRLTVSDDGDGLSTTHGPAPGGAGRAGAASAKGGLGLASMQARARQIGAEIAWKRPDSGGTAVVLVFDPGAEGSLPAAPPPADSHDRATRRTGGDTTGFPS